MKKISVFSVTDIRYDEKQNKIYKCFNNAMFQFFTAPSSGVNDTKHTVLKYLKNNLNKNGS